MNISKLAGSQFAHKLKIFLQKKGLFIGIATDIPFVKGFVHLLKKNKIDLCFDLGANSGQFALAIRKAGYENFLYSYEPNPTSFSELQFNSKLDQLWQVFQYAVSGPQDKSEVPLFVAENNNYSSSLLEPTTEHFIDFPEVKFGNLLLVPVIDINILLEENMHRNLAIKCDVQGYEKYILLAIRDELIKRIKIVAVEISLSEYYKNEWTLMECLSFFDQANFKLMYIGNEVSSADGLTLQVNLVFENLEFSNEL